MRELKTTYHQIEIAYDEESNRWVYVLWGRERFANSLQKAKADIDTPVEGSNLFEKKIAAYFLEWWGKEWQEVQVVGVASFDKQEDCDDTSHSVWVKIRDKTEKVHLKSLYAKSPKNDDLVRQIIEQEKIIKEAKAQRVRLENWMEKFTMTLDDHRAKG